MMKNLMIVGCAGMLLLAFGCEEKNPATGTTPAGTTPTAKLADQASKAAADATAAAAKASDDLKAKAVETAQTALDTVKKQVDGLGAKITAVPEAARAPLSSAYESIKTQLGAADTKLADLKSAGSDSWSKLSDEFKGLIDGLNKSVTDLTGKLPK